ncbi:MAG: diacylglycerol kinase family lipid kinase, partial [Oscillospiraceae bacterium]|nr:diacylglycerol kinase family lipid kinase [Oscillospiraceae bacterium]
ETPQKLKNRLGHAAYFVSAATALKSIHPIKVRIRTEEGFEMEDDVIFCAVSNSISLAGAIKLRRREVGLNDGVFELMIVSYPRNILEVRNKVMRLLTRDFTHEDVHLMRTRRAEFTFTEEVPWTVDGEYAGAHQTVVIENVHNAVQIFRR